MRPAGQPLLPVPPLAVAELLAAAGLALALALPFGVFASHARDLGPTLKIAR